MTESDEERSFQLALAYYWQQEFLLAANLFLEAREFSGELGG
jgi:hypothetical protein